MSEQRSSHYRNKRYAARTRRAYRIGAVAIIMILPVLLILIFQFGTEQHFKELPIMGPRSTNAAGDTVYHKLPDFQLRSQLDKPFTADSLRGKIHIADFFFTTCQGFCPQMTQAMKRIQKKLKEKNIDNVRLVSYSINPKVDTVKQLQRYAREYAIDPEYWRLLTGEKEELYRVAKRGYFLSVAEVDTAQSAATATDSTGPPGPAPAEAASGQQFVHDNRFALVDPQLRIRGYYRAVPSDRGPAQIDSLMTDLDLLRHKLRQEKQASHP
jgi:protein SCO1/2